MTGVTSGARGSNQYRSRGAASQHQRPRRTVTSLAGRVTVPDVEFGTRFRYPVADGNPEWEVTRLISDDPETGDAVWEARVVDDPDWVGRIDVFHESQIRDAVAFSVGTARLFERDDQFWAEQTPGSVVHYHNGFGEWVRCEIVTEPDGSTAAKPVALLGNWKPYDLPRRSDTGDVVLPYHARKIVEGDSWRPSCTTVYESPWFSGTVDGGDPRTMDPIPLTPPPLSDQETRTAAHRKFRNELRDLFTSTSGDVDDLVFLEQVRDRITGYLDGQQS